jgi:DNA modification methylase
MLIQGEALRIPLPAQSVHCCVTSPPYWGLRKYAGDQGDEPLGLEKTPEQHIDRIVEIMADVRRVLRDDGVLWLNCGDSYLSRGGRTQPENDGRGNRKARSELKGVTSAILDDGNLMLMPHRVALALQADGWIVRQDLVWYKRNPMPESVRGWTFTRHRVTIEKHENLQRMRTGKRRTSLRTRDLPGMQEEEVSDSKAPLSKERKGSDDDASARTTSRREREKTQSNSDSDTNAEGSGAGASSRGAQATKDSEQRRQSTRRSMAGDIENARTPLLLLQEEGSNDNGPRNSSEQGRFSLEGERSTSLSDMQFLKEGQPLATGLVDCPGCNECDPNDGYVLRKGSFRHTRAHEFIFMLTKRMQYWSNQEAVREAHAYDWHKNYESMKKQSAEGRDYFSQMGVGVKNIAAPNPSGRNPRSVLDIPTAPYKGAHYATFPPNLIAPLIRATCPRWACPVCGQGWAAVIDAAFKGRWDGDQGSNADKTKVARQATDRKNETGGGNVIGYRSTCDHPHTQDEAVPGIVFDPFVGSGTTVMVAQQLLRRGIGLDISMPYLDEQAKIRTGLGTPTKALEELPLFQIHEPR